MFLFSNCLLQKLTAMIISQLNELVWQKICQDSALWNSWILKYYSSYKPCMTSLYTVLLLSMSEPPPSHHYCQVLDILVCAQSKHLCANLCRYVYLLYETAQRCFLTKLSNWQATLCYPQNHWPISTVNLDAHWTKVTTLALGILGWLLSILAASSDERRLLDQLFCNSFNLF